MIVQYRFVLAALAFFQQSPQTQTPVPDNGQIRVDGRKETIDEQRRRASRFIRQTGILRGDVQAARRNSPLCPEIFGLDAPLAERFAARLAVVAREVGAEVASPPCRANLLVSFTDNGLAAIEDAVRIYPSLFMDLNPDIKRRLTEEVRPIRWWYAVEEIGADGRPVTNGVNFQDTPSRISPKIQRSIAAAVVLVDVRQAADTNLAMIADFVAMVGLSEIRLDAQPEASILTMLQADSDVKTMTQNDYALLRQLYRMPMDRNATRQRSVLRKALID
ncbi:hypothetical protein [Sphingomonas sp.]